MPRAASCERLVVGSAHRFADLLEEGLEPRQLIGLNTETDTCDRDQALPLAVRRVDLRLGALPELLVAQGDLVRPGDSADLDRFQSFAQTLASLPQELE
jgi:hypothetical protein